MRMLVLFCRALGLQSLPVAFGVDTAKWITVGTIDITQLSVAAYLAFGLDQKIYGAVLLGLVLPQVSAFPSCLMMACLLFQGVLFGKIVVRLKRRKVGPE